MLLDLVILACAMVAAFMGGHLLASRKVKRLEAQNAELTALVGDRVADSSLLEEARADLVAAQATIAAMNGRK